MFGKKKEQLITKEQIIIEEPAIKVVSNEVDKKSILDKKGDTVISKDSVLTGDIALAGNILIYGKVIGNITTQTGTVSILRSGCVEGEIQAASILIDGNMQGICIGESLEILEQGTFNGTCHSVNMSIRKGGKFIGQSEPAKQRIEPKPLHQVEHNKEQKSDIMKEDNIANKLKTAKKA